MAPPPPIYQRTSHSKQHSKNDAAIINVLGHRVDAPKRDLGHSELGNNLARLLLEEPEEDVFNQATSFLRSELVSDVIIVSHDSHTRRFELKVDSKGLEFPRALPPGHPIEQAVAEARLLATSGKPEDLEQIACLTTPLLKQLADHLGVDSARVYPLFDSEEDLQGALITSQCQAASKVLQPDTVVSLSRPLATYLKLHRESNYTARQRAWRSFCSKLTHNKLRVTCGIFLAITALMMVPAPHRIKADCRCEPVGSRFVVAPFEGRLLYSHVQPGDKVEAQQVIAEFDGSELRTQLAAVAAELEQARQRYKSGVATAEASTASLERLELVRLQKQREILAQRQLRLQLRSPIHGVIVSGNLEEALGATLVVGQTLFEVAPLDQLEARISVDESDIRYISEQQKVSTAFLGDLGNHQRAHVERVHPRAELLDGKNVFVVKAKLEESQSLSPGMEGKASIDVGWRPLGWLLLHKPYLSWCRFWGWY